MFLFTAVPITKLFGGGSNSGFLGLFSEFGVKPAFSTGAIGLRSVRLCPTAVSGLWLAGTTPSAATVCALGVARRWIKLLSRRRCVCLRLSTCLLRACVVVPCVSRGARCVRAALLARRCRRIPARSLGHCPANGRPHLRRVRVSLYCARARCMRCDRAHVTLVCRRRPRRVRGVQV